MKTNKYEKLDQLILNRIGNRYIPFCDIFEGAIFEECDRLTGNEPARVLDRRLQALKKKGLISACRGKGWVKV